MVDEFLAVVRGVFVLVVDRQALHGESQSCVKTVLKLNVEMGLNKSCHMFERMSWHSLVALILSKADPNAL